MVKWYWNHMERVCFLFLCNIAVVDVFVVLSLLLLFFLISWGWPKLDGKKKEWNSFVVSLNIWRLLANVGQMMCFEWEYLTASIIIRLHLVFCIIYYLEHSYKKRRIWRLRPFFYHKLRNIILKNGRLWKWFFNFRWLWYLIGVRRMWKHSHEKRNGQEIRILILTCLLFWI